MRKRKVLVAAVVLAILLAGGVFLERPRPDRVTEANFDRVQTGMTGAEVQAILGPPGDYTGGPVKVGNLTDVRAAPPVDRRECVALLTWESDSDHVVVWLNAAGLVAGKFRVPCVRQAQKPLDNLAWRLRRQLREWFPR